MSAEFDAAIAATRATFGKVESALAMLAAYNAFVKAHTEDPAALAAWVAENEAEQAKIQAAIDANPLPKDTTPPAGGTAGTQRSR